MKHLEELLKETQIARPGNSYLAAALFENRLFGYICYRLSYFFLRFIVHCSVFITEYFILSYIFREELLFNALMFRLALSVVTGFWWGMLEDLRIKVRELLYNGKKQLVRNLLSDWISFSVAVSVIYFTASVSVLGMMWSSDSEKILFAFYIFTLNFRIATQIIIQTMHSGIYAVSRIYRPAWSIIAIEFCSFLFTLIYWPLAGRFCLPLASLTSTVILSVIALRYILKAYKLSDFISFQVSFSDLMRRFSERVDLKNILLRGGSSVMMRFDAVTIGWVFYAYYHSAAVSVFFNQLLIIPFLHGTFSWALLFYFDFSKLNNPDLISYKRIYKRWTLILSVFMGVFFWLLYSLCGAVLSGSISDAFYFTILPLFILRSFFAFFQVRAFCEARYTAIIAASINGALTYILLEYFLANAAFNHYFPVLAFLVSIFSLGVCFKLQIKEYFFPVISSAGGFLQAIAGYDQKVQAGYVLLQGTASAAAQKMISRSLASKIGNRGYVCCAGRRQVFWFVDQKFSKLITAGELIRDSAGLTEKVVIKNFDYSASAAEFIKSSIFGGSLKNKLPILSEEAVKSKFVEMFPDGRMISAGHDESLTKAKDDPHYRQIIAAAFRYLRSYLPQEPGNGSQISALLSWSRIDTIFILPVSSSRSLKNEWNNFLRTVNLNRAVIADT